MDRLVSIQDVRQVCRGVLVRERKMEVDHDHSSLVCFKRVQRDIISAWLLMRELSRLGGETQEQRIGQLLRGFKERLASLLRQAVAADTLTAACQLSREIHCCVASIIMIGGASECESEILEIEAALDRILQRLRPDTFHEILYARNINYRKKSIQELLILGNGKVLDYTIGMMSAAIEQITYVLNALDHLENTRQKRNSPAVIP